jgi:hypothetical protein
LETREDKNEQQKRKCRTVIIHREHGKGNRKEDVIMKILKRGKKSPGGFNRYYFLVKNTTNNKE